MRLVSVIVPCHNSACFLADTLASIRAQTHPAVETILVNDGTDNPRDLRLLRELGGTVNRYIEQPHLGLPAARNTAFRAASADYVVPLDADDLLDPTYIAECLAVMEAHPEASFIYTDYRTFGDVRYTERLLDYNLFVLLYRNMATPSAVLVAKRAWERAGGYDESMTVGYEDWDFWLRLADHDCFGLRLPRVLFHYRRREGSMFAIAHKHHDALVKRIQANHRRLYSPEGLAEIKARWSPAACLVTVESGHQQTIDDVQFVPPADPCQLAITSKADAFVIPPPGERLDPNSAELCALAVWAGQDAVRLPDGSLSVSRRSLIQTRDLRALAPGARPRLRLRWPASRVRLALLLERLHRHLINAELLSIDSWVKHPLRSATRLIPLRTKEFINRIHPINRTHPMFDLRFYLKFQPQSLMISGQLIVPLRYCPRSSSGRRRIALFTPHLGPGDAERILLDIGESLARAQFEISLIATQSADARWREKWNLAVDHIYDLGALVPAERMAGAIYSLATNWKFETLLIQNSPSAYAAIGNIRGDQPALKVIDIVHRMGGEGDVIQAADRHIDLRIAVSEAGRRRLLDTGTAEEKIRLIRTGINLEYFQPAPPRRAEGPSVVLFAGPLDSVERPTMLVKIALELNKLRPDRDVRFLVAGDGPEGSRLRSDVRRANLQAQFSLVGTVSDIRPLLTESDVVLFPSRSEGIPFVVLEAFALQRPVVCSGVGALDEVVTPGTGILVKTGPGNVERFAMAIQSLLDDPARRREMGEAGRRLVEQEYDQARSRRQYREVFAPSAAVQMAHSTV
jgi:glycosyltransferase involved in cell wall biosynthesis/GT2 family glycosyltransferase